MKIFKILLVAGLLSLSAAVGFMYSGLYPMGANTPHTKFVYWTLETLRERSIARAAADIEVPDLSIPSLLLAGGSDYNEMCATCHLKPGRSQSDMSIGLYPAPPNLSAHLESDSHEHGDVEVAARRQFWIIKNGIKASGMPAWEAGHDDERIWAMVAFLQKLPALSEIEYQILTARDDTQSAH